MKSCLWVYHLFRQKNCYLKFCYRKRKNSHFVWISFTKITNTQIIWQITGVCYLRRGDHSVYVPSRWEMALHCNAVSHWLGAYTEWSLYDASNTCTYVLYVMINWQHIKYSNHCEKLYVAFGHANNPTIQTDYKLIARVAPIIHSTTVNLKSYNLFSLQVNMHIFQWCDSMNTNSTIQ